MERTAKEKLNKIVADIEDCSKKIDESRCCILESAKKDANDIARRLSHAEKLDFNLLDRKLKTAKSRLKYALVILLVIRIIRASYNFFKELIAHGDKSFF